MTILAILEPASLLGEAVREAVSRRAGTWERIDLVTCHPEAVGSVTEIEGRAALVAGLDPEVIRQWDVVLSCGPDWDPLITSSLPERSRIVWLDPAEEIDEAIPVVADINPQAALSTGRLTSPSAAVILISRLLSCLSEMDRVSLVAHVLEPASSRGKAGLDELFEQTRSILSMQDQRPDAVFGTQLAFNLLPWTGSRIDRAAELRKVLGFPLSAQIHTSQASVFHCCSVAMYLDLEPDPGSEGLREILQANPHIETYQQPQVLGPVATATSDRILLGNIEPSPTGGYWIWATMDNLTAAARNAVDLVLL